MEQKINAAEPKNSIAKSTLPYGIVFGVIVLLEIVTSYTLGLNAATNKTIGIVVSLLNYCILPILFIYLSANNFKNKLNGGYISFGQTIKAGVSVCVIAAFVFSTLTAILYMAMPEIKAEVLEQTKVAAAQNPGMTSEMLEQTVKMTEMFMQPYISIPFSMLMFAFIGLIWSLLVGAIVKKDNPGAF